MSEGSLPASFLLSDNYTIPLGDYVYIPTLIALNSRHWLTMIYDHAGIPIPFKTVKGHNCISFGWCCYSHFLFFFISMWLGQNPPMVRQVQQGHRSEDEIAIEIVERGTR